MSYPLTLRFKVLAVARQMSVFDADQRLLMYAKQKTFKLKEAITIFADEQQTRPLYRVAADRVIDVAANYSITDENGEYLGAIRQKGIRSLWRSHYEISRDDQILFAVREENPWSKVGNSLFESIPLIGALGGYVFHPRYQVSGNGQASLVRIEKQPAFLETAFKIERLPAALATADERLLLIGTIVMVMLERQRG